MARRSDHSREEIRQMALEAASDIVEVEGIQGLTARKVAARIGYTVGTLYLVYQNLDDLIAHVATRTLGEMTVRLKRAARGKRRPESAIRAMASAYFDYATDHSHRWRLVFEHRLPQGQAPPEHMIELRDELFAMVDERLRQLLPHRSHDEIAHIATALWSGVHGICILALTGKLYLGGAFSAGKLADTLIDSVLKGVAE